MRKIKKKFLSIAIMLMYITNVFAETTTNGVVKEVNSAAISAYGPFGFIVLIILLFLVAGTIFIGLPAVIIHLISKGFRKKEKYWEVKIILEIKKHLV